MGSVTSLEQKKTTKELKKEFPFLSEKYLEQVAMQMIALNGYSLITQKENLNIKPLINLLSTIYGNNVEMRGHLASLKNEVLDSLKTYSHCKMLAQIEETTQLAWLNEKILMSLSDIQGPTKRGPVSDSTTCGA